MCVVYDFDFMSKGCSRLKRTDDNDYEMKEIFDFLFGARLFP